MVADVAQRECIDIKRYASAFSNIQIRQRLVNVSWKGTKRRWSHESPPIPTLREKMSYIVFILDKEWSNMAACQEL